MSLTALQQAYAKLDVVPDQTRVEVTKGVTVRRKKNGLTVLSLHYSAIPERDPATEKGMAWYRHQKKKYSSEARWRREQEIDPHALGGEAVFGKILSDYYDVVVISDPYWFPDPRWDVVGGFDHGGTNATCLLKAYIPRETINPVTGKKNPPEIIIAGEYYSYRREGWQNNVEQNCVEMVGGSRPDDTVAPGMPDMDRARWIVADQSIFYDNVQTEKGAPTNIYATYKKNRMFPMVAYDGIRSDVTFVEWMMSDYWRNVAYGEEPRLRIVCRNPSDRPQPGLHPYDCPNLLWELKRAKRVEMTARQLLTKNASEMLVDKNNHGRDCLVAGTMVTTISGDVPIERVKVGDQVLTRKGWRPVEDAWLADRAAKVFKVRFSNGYEVIGTAGHKIFVKGYGFLRVDALKYGMMSLCQTNTVVPRLDIGWESGFTDIPKVPTGACALTSEMGSSISTALSGYSRTASRFPRGAISITRTTIPTITSRTTSKRRMRSLTCWSTIVIQRSGLRRSLGSHLCERKQRSGMGRLKEKHGTALLRDPRCIHSGTKFVLNAAQDFRIRTQRRGTPSATPRVEQDGAIAIDLTRSSANVSSALPRLRRISTTRLVSVPELVLAQVVEVTPISERQAVYDLTVNEQPEFFANGVLVHNCMKYVTGMLRNPTAIPAHEYIESQVKDLEPLTAGIRRRFLMSELAMTGKLNPDGTEKKGRPAPVVDLRRRPGVIR